MLKNPTFQQYMDELLDYIRSLIEFNDNSWCLLCGILTQVDYNRNDFLFQEGQISNSLFFIVKGYCRSYYEFDGTERNINFFFEKEIVGHLSISDISEKVGYNLVACEKMSVIKIDKGKLVQIARDCIEIERMGRCFIRAFAAKQDEISKMLKLVAANDRLNYIEKHYPHLVKRVPLYQLSSFLGVARETLSRIRKRRTQG